MIVSVKNTSVIIDEESLPIFNSKKWHISDTGYVVWRGISNGEKHTVRLHRLIAQAKDGEIVDHINRNKLDNRKSNLRIVTQKENVRNSDRYDNYKGYYFDNTKKRWTVDSIRHGVKSIYVDNEEDCINYIKCLERGEKPTRVFTRRQSLSARKITDEQIDYIFIRKKEGATNVTIANEIGVSYSAVGRIVNGVTTMGGTINHKLINYNITK